MLIEAGHRLEDIKNYSVAQFKMFLECANELKNERDKEFALLVRFGVWSKDKDFNDFLKEE